MSDGGRVVTRHQPQRVCPTSSHTRSLVAAGGRHREDDEYAGETSFQPAALCASTECSPPNWGGGLPNAGASGGRCEPSITRRSHCGAVETRSPYAPSHPTCVSHSTTRVPKEAPRDPVALY